MLARRFDARSRRQRSWVQQDSALDNPQSVCRQLVGERRRRAAVGRTVLVAVPRAGNAAVNDPALADGAALVRADVADGRERLAVPKHGDTFASGETNDFGTAIDNVVYA